MMYLNMLKPPLKGTLGQTKSRGVIIFLMLYCYSIEEKKHTFLKFSLIPYLVHILANKAVIHI